MLWWASGSFANVLLTMIAYKLILDDEAGVLPGGLSSWKWLHFVCVILTFIVFVPLLRYVSRSFPSSALGWANDLSFPTLPWTLDG